MRTLEDLMPLAQQAAELLIARKQTVAVAESSAGGLTAAALLAVPGASAYCRGGVVIYTRQALLGLGNIDRDALAGVRPATEAYAAFKAKLVRERFGADWGVGETGAAGPTGNSYGDPAGHACVAVAGAVNATRTIATGRAVRPDNMHAFAAAALALLVETLAAQR